ncbi:MAG: acyl-CoA dehydratase activase [Candidatus Hodarchaeota archaeon]
MTENPLYVGIDIGSSFTKTIILNRDKNIIGSNVDFSGVDLQSAAEKSLHAAIPKDLSLPDVIKIVTTGFGRRNFILENVVILPITEISCSAKAANFIYPDKTLTIIDIGGQDTKVIKVRGGKRASFKMNRKCAAGTGTFLEELALKLRISSSDLNSLANQSSNPKTISSYCTVFAGTEILTRIREGAKKEDLIRGAFHSIVKRVIEIDTIENDVVVTGGVVAHNSVIVDIFKDELDNTVLVPPDPQFFVALGAALYAIESDS